MARPVAILAGLLQLLPVVAGLETPTVIRDTQAKHHASADVAIIGAGLSGLSAAKELVKANKTVLVIEARDRVGGRTWNKPVFHGSVAGVGAEFVGPTQDRVLALATELGLEVFPTYVNGSSILWENSAISQYSSDGPTGGLPPIDAASLQQVIQAIGTLDTLAAEIDVRAPWKHPKANEWDSITFASWLDVATPLQPARFLFDLTATSVFSTESKELSFLYVLAYIAAAGNATTPGSVERLVLVANSAQESRIRGGTQTLSLRLAERLGSSRLSLSTPVRRIEQHGSDYIVVADGLSVRAKHVVVAMSPPMASRIIYSPPLPAHRDQLTQRMPMGSLGKAIAIYKTPFWRANGLNGQSLSDSGVVRSTFDSSPEDLSYASIMGFIEADEMRAYDTATDAEIIAAVTKDYVNYFGPQAANATKWVLQRWDLEEFSRGGPVAYGPPGLLTQYGPALKAPVGNLHWAGTETSDYWVGYMDGAIRSGERVAAEILTGA